MSHQTWLVLPSFMALLLSVTLLGLSASGHFPADHRLPALRSVLGRCVLYGSLIGGAVCLIAGLPLAWSRLPWYAAVIGGGAAVLFAPLVLQLFPDRFVDGYGALISFSVAGLALLLVVSWVAGAGS